MLVRTLSLALVASCCAALQMLLVSLALLLRRLPEVIALLQGSLRWILILSFRIYQAILSRLAPLSQRWLGVELLAPWPRTAASLILSLALAALLPLLLGWRLRLWMGLLPGLHGLLVGGLWDELAEPGGIRLGERLS